MTEELYHIEIRDDLFYISFKSGIEVTSELLMEAVDREIDLDESKIRDDIWDFSGCWASAELKHDSMQRLVEHIEERRRFNWHSRTALVVDQDANYGLARMFQTTAEFLSYEVGVFRDVKEAEVWLGIEKRTQSSEQTRPAAGSIEELDK